MASEGDEVSSPAATGGAGTSFEEHVDTFLLAQLLVRGVMPIARDATVEEVHLQTERLGFFTDDFLIVGRESSGRRRRLLGQSKRKLVVSAADKECRKAIGDFWRDFKKPAHLTLDDDQLVLVVQRASGALVEDLSGLLNQARASLDADDFLSRLSKTGLVTQTGKRYREELRAIATSVEGADVSLAQLFPFLRALHVLPLDLNSSTSLTEAHTKTLLAFVSGGGPARATEAWNALLAEVTSGNHEGKSYTFEQLPRALLDTFQAVNRATDRAWLETLHAHSRLILDRIDPRLGGATELARAAPTQSVLAALSAARVVVVSGPAGAGKSCVAKAAAARVAEHEPVLVFRAKEFARTHFNEVLRACQTPLTSESLIALMSQSGRALIVVDSLERLLEAATRDAFEDLVTLLSKQPSLQLLVTCRDYSVDMVREAFFRSRGLDEVVVEVPPLDDSELSEVVKQHPELARPLSVARLRPLLRSPYILDKALRVRWADDEKLPESEREFRQRVWTDVVRADHEAPLGMPARRESVMLGVALDRARALTEHVAYAGDDAEALAVLKRDSLISERSGHLELVAPSHDVLEDWAVLRWLDQQHRALSVSDLASAIGPHPALRRSYRRFVAELVDGDLAAARALFEAATKRTGSRQFCDDTFVALLQAPDVARFLDELVLTLFADQARLFRRVTFLMRTACVTTAPSGEGTVPSGPAWSAIVKLADDHAEQLSPDDDPFLLGLAYQWSAQVRPENLYPAGADAVAAICRRLCGRLKSKEQRDVIFEVLLRIPRESAEWLTQLASEDAEKRSLSSELREHLLDDTLSEAVCRDLPDLVIEVARKAWLSQREQGKRGSYSRYIDDIQIEGRFGLSADASVVGSPSSALRGPFLHLLRHQPAKGVEFLVELVNHCEQAFAARVHHSDDASEFNEEVNTTSRTRLSFDDGTAADLFCDVRSWTHFRGFGHGPALLESALMALEQWLLEHAERDPPGVDAAMIALLQRAKSVAIAAVVASVATAHPRVCPRAVLALLSSKECVRLDRARMASDGAGATAFFAGLTGRKGYEDERKRSAELSQRRLDLEHAVYALQIVGASGASLQAMIDKHTASAGPDEKAWRLALHRMDVRQHRWRAARPEELPKDATPDTGYVVSSLELTDPELRAMVDEAGASARSSDARFAAYLWGKNIFERTGEARWRAEDWRAQLDYVRSLPPVVDVGMPFEREAPGFVAAVALRDHWDELKADERAWSAATLCEEVERHHGAWEDHERKRNVHSAASRAAVQTLPLLVLRSAADAPYRDRVRRAFALGVTHPISDLRVYAAMGIAEWGFADPHFAILCVNAVAFEGLRLEEVLTPERKRAPARQRPWPDIARTVAQEVRDGLIAIPTTIPADAFTRLDIETWGGGDAFRRALVILSGAPTSAATVAATTRLSAWVVARWSPSEDEDDDPYQGSPRNAQRDSLLVDRLHESLLRMGSADARAVIEPVLLALPTHASEVAEFVEALVVKEDQVRSGARFWELWDLIGARARAAFQAGSAELRAELESVFVRLLLSAQWKKDTRDWPPLKGQEARVHALFESLPPSPATLRAYARFLFYVGSSELPTAFARLAQKLRGQNAWRMLDGGSSVWLLEGLLLRHVYARPAELKRDPLLRIAVLELLELLVQFGSSAAFLMRDDFATPLPAARDFRALPRPSASR